MVSSLREDAQAPWVFLHRSLSNKLDYHLTLCYPSDIRPVAAALDRAWAVLEQAVGQMIPRWEQGLGYECVLKPPIDNMTQLSFQELFIRTPIRQKGSGLRSMLTTCPAAFIGGVEKSLPMFFGAGNLQAATAPGWRWGAGRRMVADTAGFQLQDWEGVHRVLDPPADGRSPMCQLLGN